MSQNPPIIDETLAQNPDNSPGADAEEAKETIDTAADRVADLIWRHWLYMQEKKKRRE